MNSPAPRNAGIRSEPLLHAETITIQRRDETGRDDYNQPVYGWTEHDESDVNVQPVASSDTRINKQGSGGTELVTNRLFVSGPLGMDVGENDRIRWRGTDFQVDGIPHRCHTGLGLLDHTEFTMTVYKG